MLSGEAMSEKKPANQHRTTPQSVMDAVHKFAKVALDPCWNEYALTEAEFVCDGVQSDGLTADWSDAVWSAAYGNLSSCVYVNPPWGDPLPWIEKVVAEHKRDENISILLWLPVYPETAASRLIWQNATRICFWGKRINHLAPPIDASGALISGGTPVLESGSKLPTWLSYFGPHGGRFDHAFKPHGNVVWGWQPMGVE
jgi:hypothetical protein